MFAITVDTHMWKCSITHALTDTNGFNYEIRSVCVFDNARCALKARFPLAHFHTPVRPVRSKLVIGVCDINFQQARALVRIRIRSICNYMRFSDTRPLLLLLHSEAEMSERA